MLTLLIAVGAVVVFLAGVAVARLTPRQTTAPPTVATGTSTPLVELPTYRDVLDEHTIGVVIGTAKGTTEYANDSARALSGTTVGILVDEAVARHLESASRGGTLDEVMEFHGPPRLVAHLVSRPLPDGRCVVFVTDITERRRIEQVRTDFVANVSHELRTPIGAIMVLAETLDTDDDPEVTKRIVERMEREATRATRTIDDLLELSRLESLAEIDREPVPMADIVREALHRVAELASLRQIAISTIEPVDGDGPRSASVVVMGDRRQLASAVGNLVENAVKYSEPDDTVQVRVRVVDGVAELSVIDEGVGIPRNDLDRVFERFYRVDRARSRATGGTGLGLSIVRHVAHRHGGSVSVESVEGEGTTFSLRLPLAEKSAGEEPAALSDGAEPTQDSENGTGAA